MEEPEYLESRQLARHAAQCVGRMFLYQDQKPSTVKYNNTVEETIYQWKRWKGSILPHRKRVRSDRKKGRRM